MTQNLENYWWTDSNLTAICNTNCSQEVTFWSTDALADCDNQYYTAYGKRPFMPSGLTSGLILVFR